MATADLSQPTPKCVLPPEKVFSIQIGTELFRLSGASISSDAPSYFSHFFEEQLRHSGDRSGARTLYIDRDSCTFKDIVRHLQGYHVQPRDGAHFVRLFADAQFYSLPRLLSQLFESETFVQIGDRHFQVPRDIFSSPGDSPNFFTLGFTVFFSSRTEVLPGLDRTNLLRPPAIIPPCVPNRSGDSFAELLHLLRGYPLHIRDEDHRAQLLRDCRYYHLRGLEQRLIPHDISFNAVVQRSEIVIRLEDVRQSGVQFTSDTPATPGMPSGGRVTYSRPFVDETTYDLVIEIGHETTAIDIEAMRADFFSLTKVRIGSLSQVVANKMDLPKTAPLGEEKVKIQIPDEADLAVDGESVSWASQDITAQTEVAGPPAKRKRVDGKERGRWVVRTGQWRLRARPNTTGDGLEVVLVAVKLDVYTEQRVRNKARAFLTR